MNTATSTAEEALLQQALASARDTRSLVVAAGARLHTPSMFRSLFGDRPAVVVADARTFAAAGADVSTALQDAGIPCETPFLFEDQVYAEHRYAEQLRQALGETEAIPVAVGSGTVNDLTKLAAHRLGRPYLAVATAASMDGYTAYGASITYRGSKQTFDCPAPRGVLADLDVIARAPQGMNASGYADLFAKGVAGADWLLADGLDEEPLDPGPWNTVQRFLPGWVGSPGGVAAAEPECLRHLVTGLMLSGFAMQAARTSRPASGAEHQFSHLWDMQHHTHEGAAPSHGFKVGIGTLASLDLYEVLLRQDLTALDVEGAVAAWPSLAEAESRIGELFGPGELVEKALLETRAKHPTASKLRTQLRLLQERWPALRERLTEHLKPFRSARTMLAEAGCPNEPEQIGISRERLRRSYEQAYYLRRRFTVLDFAQRLGLLDAALNELFGSEPPDARGGTRR